MRNRIVAAIRDAEDAEVRQAAANVTSNFVFEHPTLRELAEAISHLVDPTGTHEKEVVSATVKLLLEKYSASIPKAPSATKIPSTSVVVLLTGSTGNVGSHVLASLLSEPRISKVYTLNRRAARTDRQKVAFEERGISVDLLSHTKLTQLFGDVALPNFGVDDHMYREVGVPTAQRSAAS